MADNKNNIIELKSILSRFFDKKFKISEEALLAAINFLFEGIESAEVQKHSEVENTLVYLKDVIERNNFETLNELKEYYDGKHKKINHLFDKLKEVNPEECFAVKFNHAYSMFLTPVEQEHKFKEDNLYYLQNADRFCVSENKTIYQQCDAEFNLQDNWLEQEKNFLSQVKGNCLLHQEKKYNMSRNNTDALISN